MRIPLQKPVFDRGEEEAIIEVLRSGWVTQGPRVAEFEKMVCEFTGTKYGVATTSATTALFLSLHLLGIGRGDEVIVPSFTFIATPNIVVHTGAKPVFVDINPKTYNISPEKIREAITKKTKAIIPADQVGLACDMKAIMSLAKKHKLYVIEDAACALGSEYRGKKVGAFGEIAAFSFHPRKTITTGEGGMVLTSNKNWADKLRILRHHGMSISDVARHKSKTAVREQYNLVGYNFRMSDIQAAVGIAQMKKLHKILKKRTKLANRYTKAFLKSKYIIPPYVPEGHIHNWQSYVVRLLPNGKISRDALMQKLLDEGIATRIGVMAAHLEPVYRKMLGKISLPETEAATRETITLPLYPQMTNKEQDYVIQHIKEAIGEA